MIEATVANTVPLFLHLQDKGNMELYHLLTDNVKGNPTPRVRLLPRSRA